MARLSRDSRLETREARSRLKPSRNNEPYWRQIHPGLAIGYYKGPNGGAWFVRRLVDGKYKKERLGTADDRQDANGLDVLNYQQAHRKALEMSDTAAKRGAGHDYTVEDAMTDYLTWFKSHRKAYHVTEVAINAHIIPSLGKKRVDDLTAVELRKWHQGIAAAPIRKRGKLIEFDANDPEAVRKRRASANRILTILKAALNHAWHEGRVSSADAWSRCKPFRSADAPKVRYLSQEECKRLLNASPADFRDLARGALLTGCRYGELIDMQCHDYNRDSGTVLVRESKGGKFRHIPLTDEGRQFFDRITAGKAGEALIFTKADGTAWGKSHQTRPMKEACKAAKIAPLCSFHDLRHTYGSLLAMRGTPLQVIASAMGHADTRMTMRHYAHLMPSYVADTIRANLPSFGIEKDNVSSIGGR